MPIRADLVPLTLLLALAMPGTQARCQEAPDLEVVPLSEQVVILRLDGRQPTNLIGMNTREGIVVIDSGISAVVAEAARKRFQEIFRRDDFAYLINTHDHGDHTYGNKAFADLTIVGQEGVPEQMEANEEQRHQTLQRLRTSVGSLRERLEGLDPSSEQAASLKGTIAYYDLLASGMGDDFQLTPPTRTFRDHLTLDLGDHALELYYYGKAHSGTDILVFSPEDGILATGDLFAPGMDPYIDSERVPFLARWLENLDWILDDEAGVQTIIPGHGDPIPLEELARVRDHVRNILADLSGKESAFTDFRQVFETKGAEAALLRMEELKSRPEAFFFFHAEFDSFAYRLMLDNELEQAIPLFEKLAGLFPEVPNAFDSLGEAYLRAERPEEAEVAFETCLALDPEHQNARRRLAEIGGEGQTGDRKTRLGRMDPQNPEGLSSSMKPASIQ